MNLAVRADYRQEGTGSEMVFNGAMRGPVILAQDVDVVVKGGRRLLDEVSFEVSSGECWALLGPNGAGKTTLLSLLGALRHPTSGSVRLLGETLGRVDVQSLWKRIGHVQGRHRPVGPLTCHELILTGVAGTNALPPRWVPDRIVVDRARELEQAFGIAALADRPWQGLSNGEYRKALVARALMNEPSLLLLDEPSAGLDMPGRELLIEAIDKLLVEQPTLATVLVTHHVEEIPSGTSHALLMRDGRVLARGPAEEVLDDYNLSACFGLPLEIHERGRRWSARIARHSTSSLVGE